MEQSARQLPEWTKAAEVELVYKSKVKASQRPVIRDSNDSYIILRQTWDENKIEMLEEFKVLFLNRGNRVLGVYEVSSGGISGTIADPRLILAAAIKTLAVNIILSHNHPSGNLKPSKADEEITMKIKEAGKFHDITVLDHIILNSETYLSFADEGLM